MQPEGSVWRTAGPCNNKTLASDASTSWGMAGVLFFGRPEIHARGIDGLF